MATLRTSKEIKDYFISLGIDSELINSVSINIQNNLFGKGVAADGLYIHSFGKDKKPALWVRSIKNLDRFHFVCLHELGHHMHYSVMPSWTKNATESQKEGIANLFAYGEYKRFVS